MADDDALVDMLTRGRKPAERKDEREAPTDSTLPDPGRDYEPFSRPWIKPLYTLHCILGRDGCQSFSNMQLDSGSTFSTDPSGQVIRLRFCGSKTTAVTIRGRNLWKLYDYLHQHRIAWVMAVDRGRDFAADDAPVITSIQIEDVKDSPAE